MSRPRIKSIRTERVIPQCNRDGFKVVEVKYRKTFQLPKKLPLTISGGLIFDI